MAKDEDTKTLDKLTKEELVKLAGQLQTQIEKMADKNNQSVYKRLSKIDVSRFTKTFNDRRGLTYLSWANAWGLVKSIYPDATYSIKEYPRFVQDADGHYQQVGTIDYRTTSAGVEVEASVTIKGQTYSSKLFVMDHRNKALAPNRVTYFEINKTQMRALTKALAFAGLGLNIYAGEDLPSGDDETPQRQKPATRQQQQQRRTYNNRRNYSNAGNTRSQAEQAANRIADKIAKRVAGAKRYKVQYGGGQELLTDIIGLEEDGDKQAKTFLKYWTVKDEKYRGAYEFIKKNNLETHNLKVSA